MLTIVEVACWWRAWFAAGSDIARGYELAVMAVAAEPRRSGE